MGIPFVTVIVPVRNEEACLADTLLALLRQDYPADRFEVIVADGQSGEGTVAVVRRLQAHLDNLILLYNPSRLASAARHLGVRHPRGSLAGLARQMARYGRGRARLLLKHPATFSVTPLIPALFLAELAASFALGFVAPPFAALFCLTALFYSLAVVMASLDLTLRS